MDAESQYRTCEAARVEGALSVQDLWLRYVALGGNRDLFAIDGYLQGLLPLESFEERVLVVALDERLVEVRRPAPLPLPDPTDLPLANGDLRQAVIDGLLGRDPPQAEPDATS